MLVIEGLNNFFVASLVANPSGFINSEEARDIIGVALKSGHNITITVDDDNDSITIDTQIVDDLVSTDTDKSLSANQGKVLKGITDDLNDKKAIKAQDYDTETTYKDKEDDTLYKLYVDNGDIVLEEV